MMKLNKEQHSAVVSNSKHIIVIAGAGTGKTTTIIHRIGHLLNTKRVNPKNCLCLCFNRSTVAQMKHKLKEIYNHNNVDVFSYHQYALRIIRKHLISSYFNKNFIILDSSDVTRIIRRLLALYKKKHGQKHVLLKVRDITNYLYTFKKNKPADQQEKWYLEAKQKYSDKFYQPDIKEDIDISVLSCITWNFLNEQYKNNQLTYDDLISYAYHSFCNNFNSFMHWQQQYNAIFVDEFQDIDMQQLTIVTKIITKNHYFFCVGDPDQCIYEWRGACHNFVPLISKLLFSPKIITLTKNYRSYQSILSLANCIIENNVTREEKLLVAERKNRYGDLPSICTNFSQYECAKLVIDKIKKRTSDTNDYKKFAVLSRNNRQKAFIEVALLQEKIPFFTLGGQAFLDRFEIKIIRAYLGILMTGNNSDFDYAINIPKRSIGATTLINLHELANHSNTTVVSYLKNNFSKIPRKKINRCYQELKVFLNQLKDWENDFLNKKISLVKLIDRIINDCKISEYLQKYDTERKEEEYFLERLKNINIFKKTIDEFSKTLTIHEILETLSLDTTAYSPQKSGVALATIHGVKGLEYDNVFIIGLRNDIFPSLHTVKETIFIKNDFIKLLSTKQIKNQYLIENSLNILPKLKSLITELFNDKNELSGQELMTTLNDFYQQHFDDSDASLGESLVIIRNIINFIGYESERRLFYVAITRAKNNLWIFQDIYENANTVFIDEILKNANKTLITKNVQFKYFNGYIN